MSFKMDSSKGTWNTDQNKMYPGEVIIDLDTMRVVKEASNSTILGKYLVGSRGSWGEVRKPL